MNRRSFIKRGVLAVGAILAGREVVDAIKPKYITEVDPAHSKDENVLTVQQLPSHNHYIGQHYVIHRTAYEPIYKGEIAILKKY